MIGSRGKRVAISCMVLWHVPFHDGPAQLLHMCMMHLLICLHLLTGCP